MDGRKLFTGFELNCTFCI